MRVSVIILCLAVLCVGCKKKKSTEDTSTGTSSPTTGGPGFGTIQAVRGAAVRIVSAHELNNLRLFIENYSLSNNQMPSVAEIHQAVQQSDRKLWEMIQGGDIVLTGIKQREGCWAYAKEAPEKGGWILTHSGAERVDSATAKRWIYGQ